MTAPKTSGPAMVAFLKELLRQAELNEITEVFLWIRAGDGSTDYQYLANDTEDMLFELGTVILDERINLPGLITIQ